MHLPRLRFTLLSVALFVTSALPAQEATTSPVTIIVIDPIGAPIPHAEIRLVPSSSRALAKMETDAKGQLSVDLKPGGYALFVSSPGFRQAAQHVDVRETKEAQILPVSLQLGPAGSAQIHQGSKDDLRLVAYPYHEDVWLKPSDVRALPHITVTVHNPHSKADEIYSGVRVAELFAKLGVVGKEFDSIAHTSYLVVAGSDGYQALVALAEVDPSFHPGEVLVADTMNGHPLDAKSGPFKLVVTEDKHPSRNVRNLILIELRSAH